MSIPRRRRSPLRIALSNIESAIDDLEARVTALEEQEEDVWLDYEPEGNVGVGSTSATVTIPTETLVSLITTQNINTSMAEVTAEGTPVGVGSSTGNVGVGSTATSGNVGVGSTAPAGTTETTPVTPIESGNVGVGSTATSGNVGIGSSNDPDFS